MPPLYYNSVDSEYYKSVVHERRVARPSLDDSQQKPPCDALVCARFASLPRRPLKTNLMPRLSQVTTLSDPVGEVET